MHSPNISTLTRYFNQLTLALLSLTLLTLISTARASDFSEHLGYLPDGPEITQEDVENAQKAWGDAVVAIGKAGKDAARVAEQAARTAYAFDLGPIQFKPTLA